MPTTTAPATAEQIADAMKKRIRADIDAERIPAKLVRSFSDLHDHCDANVVYLGAARVDVGLAEYDGDSIDLDNAALAIVDKWLGSPRRHF